MGFLLSGLSQPKEITLLHEDTWIIVANKPAGLLSVPGRTSDRQDSLLTRLRDRFPHDPLFPVHRLDQDTSGILLFARDLDTYRRLTRQFQERRVYKGYEAILAGPVIPDEGVIDLPLWGDPGDRPYQKVNHQLGKPSVTKFRVLSRKATYTRVEFLPLTGRTHQLRVHAAEGLGAPIVGDRLYGKGERGDRLCLHARELHFEHPWTGGAIVLRTETPF
jgi:tRNA pseudouridine32 synthase/23S rRNA pseudouridine746 synthase